MKKLTYSDIYTQQLVDIREQFGFQEGHLKNSINLNPKNFKRYANQYLDTNQPLVFIVGSKEVNDLDELLTVAEEKGFKQIDGYIEMSDIPTEALEKMGLIPAEDFLKKDEGFILLDVRHPDEITRPAPTKNLFNMPFEDLSKEYQTLDSDKEIYTLCGSGNRSTSAASFLKAKGFNVKVVEGGMKAIQEVNGSHQKNN